jgi:hypothetical protein
LWGRFICLLSRDSWKAINRESRRRKAGSLCAADAEKETGVSAKMEVRLKDDRSIHLQNGAELWTWAFCPRSSI